MALPAGLLAAVVVAGIASQSNAQAIHVPPPSTVQPALSADEPPFENPFRVTNVLVDRRAGNAAQARELAIRDGQRLAWRRLVDRLAPQADRAEHARLPDGRIDELFDYFEVQRERISGTRYAAILTFAFKPDQIRTLFNRSELPSRAEVIRREQEQRNRDEEPPERPPVNRLTARVPVNSMNDLIQVRRRLSNIPLLRRADQISLTRTEALFELHYVGEESALIEALRQREVGLARAPDGWNLTVLSVGGPTAAPPAGTPSAPAQGAVRLAPERVARPPTGAPQ
jgi:hypothetical protein